MATDRTKLTELGTAAGLVYEPDRPWPEAVERLDIPGVASEVWHPVVLPATATAAPDRDLLLMALANGQAFRRSVLGGRRPNRVQWVGGRRSIWSADVPRDLVVDRVYFIQAKYDSRCVLNRAPAAVFDDLLLERDEPPAASWYAEVAPYELAAYYDAVRDALAGDQVASELPASIDGVDTAAKAALKLAMRGRSSTTADEDDAYGRLCRAVSMRTADRWLARWSQATRDVRERMIVRMLRISGGPYWLLGTKGTAPVRLAVTDTHAWSTRFRLRTFEVQPAGAGQPQVNWQATVADRDTRAEVVVDGYCEVRWSHGKLQGAPECKVQVTTPLADLPGYDPL